MIFLLNILITILGIGLVVVIVFAIALINASKKSTKDSDDLTSQVKQAITHARRIRLKAESDIGRLRVMASDTISTALEGKLPASVSTEQLLDNFEQLTKTALKHVEPQIVEKTAQLLAGYKAQIQLKEKEMQMAQAIEDKYTKLLEEIKEAARNEKINQRLGRQQQKLAQMQGDASAQKQLIEQTYSYDMIAQDVSQKVQYLKALEELQTKYDSPELITSTEEYQQELEKITQHLQDEL